MDFFPGWNFCSNEVRLTMVSSLHGVRGCSSEKVITPVFLCSGQVAWVAWTNICFKRSRNFLKCQQGCRGAIPQHSRKAVSLPLAPLLHFSQADVPQGSYGRKLHPPHSPGLQTAFLCRPVCNFLIIPCPHSCKQCKLFYFKTIVLVMSPQAVYSFSGLNL